MKNKLNIGDYAYFVDINSLNIGIDKILIVKVKIVSISPITYIATKNIGEAYKCEDCIGNIYTIRRADLYTKDELLSLISNEL